MVSFQRLILGGNDFAFERGQSAHGRWRAGYARAAASPATPAALTLTLDAARLVFVLAEGSEALAFAERLGERLWTQETLGDDWPAPLVAWLDDRGQWSDLPAEALRFVVGRIDRQPPVSFLSLAWLGLSPARLLDRSLVPLDLGARVPPPVAHWSVQQGFVPDLTALGIYRSSLFGMERLLLLSSGAEPLAADLPDLSRAQVQQALQDWRAEATADLVILEVRLAPVLAEPSAVTLSCRWPGPDLCELRWNPSPNATGYRLETSFTPDFAVPELLAELTDGRQIRYVFSPPPDRRLYVRAVPLNQGNAGQPSAPVCPLPLTLVAPVMQPVRWAGDGGYVLSWTPIPQATGYEVQTAPGERFEAGETTVVYRGERPECRLPLGTPPAHYYRVRAINALYAPATPSPWSEAVQAPARLDTPVFNEVTHERLSWTPVTGAQRYQVQIVPLGLDERRGEEVTVGEPVSAVSRVPAAYRVRALRQADDLLTASEWSAPVTIAAGAAPSAALSAPAGRSFVPVIIAAALVALLVGAALGIGGVQVYQSANATATDTPLPMEVIAATQQIATLAAERATQVAVLEVALQRTLDAEMTRTHQPSATPSPTPTFTPTHTPSRTPNTTATRDAIVATFAADLTRTAVAFTATPSPSPTHTPTPTPSPTFTRTPSPTPDLSATAAALAAEMLSRTACALVNRDNLSLPVFSGPYAGDRQLMGQAPLLAEVVENKTLTAPGGTIQRWLHIVFLGDMGRVEGWLNVPPGADLTRLIAGPDCPR